MIPPSWIFQYPSPNNKDILLHYQNKVAILWKSSIHAMLLSDILLIFSFLQLSQSYPLWKNESCWVVSNSLWPHELYSGWNSLGQNTGVGSLSLLQEIFQPRDGTQVSHIAGRFFASWVTREAEEYWSGEPVPSPADLPDPGIKPESPVLQVDSSTTELSGKPICPLQLILKIQDPIGEPHCAFSYLGSSASLNLDLCPSTAFCFVLLYLLGPWPFWRIKASFSSQQVSWFGLVVFLVLFVSSHVE